MPIAIGEQIAAFAETPTQIITAIQGITVAFPLAHPLRGGWCLIPRKYERPRNGFFNLYRMFLHIRRQRLA